MTAGWVMSTEHFLDELQRVALLTGCTALKLYEDPKRRTDFVTFLEI